MRGIDQYWNFLLGVTPRLLCALRILFVGVGVVVVDGGRWPGGAIHALVVSVVPTLHPESVLLVLKLPRLLLHAVVNQIFPLTDYRFELSLDSRKLSSL